MSPLQKIICTIYPKAESCKIPVKEHPNFFMRDSMIKDFERELDKGSHVEVVLDPITYHYIFGDEDITKKYEALVDKGLYLAFNPDLYKEGNNGERYSNCSWLICSKSGKDDPYNHLTETYKSSLEIIFIP